jgi:hypothetical protein
MKQKDIAVIAIIIFISAIFSYVISNKLFAAPASREQTVDIVQPISSAFPQPDKAFFNSGAYDPTQLIQIGQSNNTNPFSTTSN